MARGKRWGLLLILLLVLIVAVAISISRRLPSGSVLVLEAGGTIAEQAPAGLLAQVSGSRPVVLHHLLDAIRHAKDDDRVAGLVVKITPLDTGMAKIQELRGAIQDFRQSNKPSICYLHADQVDNRQYYLATACEQVWIVPTAPLGVVGMMSSSSFLRGTLDKLNIHPDLYHIAEYKTAKNLFTERQYTPAHREVVQAILSEVYAQYLTEAAQARNLDRAQFEKLVAGGPYLNAEALEHKLVDRAAYWDEVHEFFRERTGDWKPLSAGRYLRHVGDDSGEKIAIVHATGTIVVGKSDHSPVMGYIMGSDSVAADLRTAREDDSIKAIVFRIDSGGGSAVASEIIRREVELAKAKKPVVVSMSDVAGSGGYWIAMTASRILADPATITGSIGVVYGKLNVRGLLNLVGISSDHFATTDNATIWWQQQNFTPAQREQVLRLMRSIYDDFIRGVAQGRNMTPQAVDQIGKGRIWTGSQGRERNLVDEMGGMERAVAVARELADISPDADIQRVRFPREVPLWQRLLSMGEDRPTLADMLAAEKLRLESMEAVQARMPFEVEIR